MEEKLKLKIDMVQREYRYFAFISYNSKDTEWGKRIQRKLERYRMPATLCSEHGWERTPIKPVFFAPTDIQPGGLTEELQERLKASRNLIVVCSPNSARSEWVGREIEFFHLLGRTKQIHFFIVGGEPHSGNPETECFNPIVDTLGLPEILGANIHEKIYRWPWLNKERAYVQLISKLLAVEFDAIWQRHKRLLIQRIVAWALVIAAVGCLWIVTVKSIIPFASEVRINEASPENTYLPTYSGGITSLYLGDEVLTDTIRPEKGGNTFGRIPPKYHNQKIRITFQHPDYLAVDTLISLSEKSQLDIFRNPDVYGHIRFRLWSMEREEPVPNCKIVISDKSGQNKNGSYSYTATSNPEGMIDVNIPIEHQRPAYAIESDLELKTSVIYMPCGKDDVVLVK